jgi:serine/threonine-protein kinase HipA
MAIEQLGLGYGAIDQAFLRMVFNVCMANNDDHTKNHSFVLGRGGVWQLAPAYDVTHAYNKHSLWTSRHLMSVNGRFDGITREDVFDVARRFKVSAPEESLHRVLEVATQWEDYAHEAGVADESIKTIRQDINTCSALLR